MKEHGLLFSGDMVRELLAGHKTMTRRPMRMQPVINLHGLVYEMKCGGSEEFLRREPWHFCSPGFKPGNRIWVRETWCHCSMHGGKYRATDKCNNPLHKWIPSIHMPRWAARIVLEIVNVRAERVQEITPEDSVREGMRDTRPHDPLWKCAALQDFRNKWVKIYGIESWKRNDYVWVITTRLLQ
jgi:hypothetical protein